MSSNLIVGFSGNTTRPSSTRRFVQSVAEALAQRAGLDHVVFDIEDLGRGDDLTVGGFPAGANQIQH